MRQIILFSLALLFFACNGDQPTDAASSSNQTLSGPYLSIQDFKSKAEKPNITLQVEGLNSGYAYLIGVFQDQNYKADSAQINSSGVANFTADEPYFPGLLYVALPNGANFQILVDIDQTFTLKTSAANLTGAMQVEGSLDNELLYQTMKFEDTQRPLFQQNAAKMQGVAPGTEAYKQLNTEQDKLLDDRAAYLDKIFKEHPDALFTKFKKAGQNPDVRDAISPTGIIDTARYSYLFRTRFWNDVDFNDERLLYTPVISNKLKRYINELTVQNPDSITKAAYFLVDQVVGKPEYFKYFANFVVLNYDPKTSTLMDPQAVFVNMVEKYFTYERAFWSDSVEVYALQQRAYEMSASLTGKKGPDVKANDPNGQLRSIYEMKSPYIIVYMWNPECEHCAEQTPQLVRNYAAWKNQGIDVYGIAVNTEDAAWRGAIQKYGMPWVNVFDKTNKSIYGKYYVDNTPEIYVLNPDRTIIAKNLQVDQIMTVIERDRAKRK